MILFVSSHGGVKKDRNGFYEVINAFDKVYRKAMLWECFEDKPQWRGKPLLFFFQACRGNDATPGVRLSIDVTAEMSNSMIAQNSFHELKLPNLFIMNATQPDAVAFKDDMDKSSMFVDEIYNIFSTFSNKLDLYSMAVKVCAEIARKCENCNYEYTEMPEKYDCSQQMPCFESTLTSKLVMSDCDFNYDETQETFYTQTEKPVILLINYTSNDDEETNRIKRDAETLMNWFLFNGYDCKDGWDLTYADYLHLSNSFFIYFKFKI